MLNSHFSHTSTINLSALSLKSTQNPITSNHLSPSHHALLPAVLHQPLLVFLSPAIYSQHTFSSIENPNGFLGSKWKIFTCSTTVTPVTFLIMYTVPSTMVSLLFLPGHIPDCPSGTFLLFVQISIYLARSLPSAIYSKVIQSTSLYFQSKHHHFTLPFQMYSLLCLTLNLIKILYILLLCLLSDSHTRM